MTRYIDYQDSSGNTGLTLTAKIFKNGVLATSNLTVPHVSGGFYEVAFPDETAGNYFIQLLNGSTVIGSAQSTAYQIEIFTGTVAASPSPTLSQFKCSTLASTDNIYRHQYCHFNTGPLTTVSNEITAYNGTTKILTFATAWPITPVAGNSFSILGHA